LTFEPPKQYHFWGIPRSFPIPSLNTFGSFVFELCSGQTNKQTDSKTLPTLTDIVSMGNKIINNEQKYRCIYTGIKCMQFSADLRAVDQIFWEAVHVNIDIAVLQVHLENQKVR